MNCPQCGRTLHRARKTINRLVGGQSVDVREVPVFACDNCGAVVLSAAVVRRMNVLLQSTDASVFLYADDEGWKERLSELAAVLRSKAPDEPVMRQDLLELAAVPRQAGGER